MSIARIIRASTLPAVAWKNGGGTTREIAVHPPGAGMDDFVWRLSMARVEAAGPFSRFEGIDRKLAMIEGTLRLSGPDVVVDLTPVSAPFAFDGGADIAGEPLGGIVLDLNAMARRGHCALDMRRLGPGDLATAAGSSFIVALERQQLGDVTLDRLDCALLSGDLRVAGAALGIRFTP